jgi:hypothetical protein
VVACASFQAIVLFKQLALQRLTATHPEYARHNPQPVINRVRLCSKSVHKAASVLVRQGKS